MKPKRGSGDKGETSLYGGERVSKVHRRVEACGAIDELNSTLGALTASLPASEADLASKIKAIQRTLFAAGAAASGGGKADGIPNSEVESLERETDELHRSLPALRGFILPGGHISAAWAHVARAVCRRAERRVVAALNEETGGDEALESVAVYLNRLSDFLFCVARHCNAATGTPEERSKG